MQDEELFVGGYILRRKPDTAAFLIENTFTGELRTVTEKRLQKLLDGFFLSLALEA